MKPTRITGAEAFSEPRTGGDGLQRSGFLDEQFAGLIEAVWDCERQWKIDDRIDAAIRYGRA